LTKDCRFIVFRIVCQRTTVCPFYCSSGIFITIFITY
jgi:hypothetical protein